VREDCSRSDGWCAGPETEFEAEPGEKAEGCTREKHQPQEVTPMQVIFNIPSPLREFTGNQRSVRVAVGDGANLLQALDALSRNFQGSTIAF